MSMTRARPLTSLAYPSHPQHLFSPSPLSGAVLLTFGLGISFLLFDCFSRRHARRIYRAATVATAHHVVDREKIRGRHAFIAMARTHACHHLVPLGFRPSGFFSCNPLHDPPFIDAQARFQVSHEIRTPASAIIGARANFTRCLQTISYHRRIHREQSCCSASYTAPL